MGLYYSHNQPEKEVTAVPEFKIYIDAVRVNTGMKQIEWAEALGVSPSSVSMWEAGKVSPDFEVVEKMAKLSGIPIQYISVRSNPNK